MSCSVDIVGSMLGVDSARACFFFVGPPGILTEQERPDGFFVRMRGRRQAGAGHYFGRSGEILGATVLLEGHRTAGGAVRSSLVHVCLSITLSDIYLE